MKITSDDCNDYIIKAYTTSYVVVDNNMVDLVVLKNSSSELSQNISEVGSDVRRNEG